MRQLLFVRVVTQQQTARPETTARSRMHQLVFVASFRSRETENDVNQGTRRR